MNKLMTKRKESNMSLERRDYVSPMCCVTELMNEGVICVSVGPDAGGSTMPNWDNKGEHDAGTVIIGDESSMAPAKQSGWFDDEDGV